MNDSVLARFTGKRSDESPAAGAADSEELDDFVSFGFLRGTRDRALMLELRKKDGSVEALGYAWLERAHFDPSDGITLHVAGRTVRIKGRDLNGEIRPNVRLFQGITRHRVPWVQEADNATAMESRGKGMLVESIEW